MVAVRVAAPGCKDSFRIQRPKLSDKLLGCLSEVFRIWRGNPRIGEAKKLQPLHRDAQYNAGSTELSFPDCASVVAGEGHRIGMRHRPVANQPNEDGYFRLAERSDEAAAAQALVIGVRSQHQHRASDVLDCQIRGFLQKIPIHCPNGYAKAGTKATARDPRNCPPMRVRHRDWADRGRFANRG